MAESREQICRLPSGTRLPSILLADRNAKGRGEAPSSAVDSHGLPAAATRRLEDPDHSRIH